MQLKTYTTLMLALLVSSLSLTAQAFYSEDFSGGAIPADWTNVDATSIAGQECLFVFTLDAGAPGFGQDDFMASSTMNGFVIANSDAGVVDPGRTIDHTTQLTTGAIDCSGQATVWLGFETLLGVFNVTAEGNAIVRVSTDGTTWTDFTAFPGFVATNSWTTNPRNVTIDISSVAANQATVFVQWQWVGNWEYTWSIDDVGLYITEPRPSNDMRVNTFAAIAPNAITPASQVEPFGFIADIENVGNEAQNDVDLVISIIDDSGVEVFNDVLQYGTIASDSLAENVLFNNEFTPAAEVKDYVGTYSLDYESTEDDGFPLNNQLSFSFSVSDTLFSKETGRTREVRPTADLSYTYGNVFYVKNATDLNGNQLYARYISFAVHSSVPANMVDKTVSVFLYKWDGALAADSPNDITQDQYQFAGISEYIFNGSEGNDLIHVQVNEEEPLALEANTFYMPAIQYSVDADEVQFFMEASEAYDYAATNFYSDSLAVLNNDPALSRYGAILDVGNEGTLGLIGFGLDIVPVVRLSIGAAIMTATEEPQLAAGSVSIFPNPAKDYAKVELELEEVTSGTVQVLDIQGKVVQTHTLNNVQNYSLQLDTKDLASGQYTLRVQTELGVTTQKLVVQH